MERFSPPLVFTTETKDMIICFSGDTSDQARPLHKPLRQATKGQLSIYGSFENAETSIVIAMSFEEDKLPVLGRQTYYHFLDPTDFFWVQKGWVEFGLHNYITTTTEKEYQKLVSWKINLGSHGVTEAVQKIVTQLRSPADKLFRVSELPRDTREALYFNLRANLVELPVPRELGSACHWQRPTASGTPQIMPYVEREYRNHKLEEWENRDQLEETQRLEVQKTLIKLANERSWEELALSQDPETYLAPESSPPSPPGDSQPSTTSPGPASPKHSGKVKTNPDYPSPPTSLDSSPPRDKESNLVKGNGSFHPKEASSNTLSLVGIAGSGSRKTNLAEYSPDREFGHATDDNKNASSPSKSAAFGSVKAANRPKVLTDHTAFDSPTSDFSVFDDAGRPMGMISFYQEGVQGDNHLTFSPRTTGTAIQVNTGMMPSRDNYAGHLRKALEGTFIYRKASALTNSNGNGEMATFPNSAAVETSKKSSSSSSSKNPKESEEANEWKN